jgi:hypothetical protein
VNGRITALSFAAAASENETHAAGQSLAIINFARNLRRYDFLENGAP